MKNLNVRGWLLNVQQSKAEKLLKKVFPGEKQIKKRFIVELVSLSDDAILLTFQQITMETECHFFLCNMLKL